MPTKEFPLNLIDGHPVIEENSNIILIDTGSPVSIYSRNTLSFMESDFQVTQNYGGVTIPALCDLLGTRITTLLGMDILSGFRIIFDYPGSAITFSNENNLEFQGETVDLTSEYSIPVIDAIVNNRTIPCFLDSGARMSYLKAEETRNYHNLGNTEDFYPGAGRFNTPAYEIETRVGTRVFSVLYGNLPRPLEGQLLTLVRKNNGIIGYDLFNKYKIYLHAALHELKIADPTQDNRKLPGAAPDSNPGIEPWDPFNPGPGTDPDPKHDFLFRKPND